jgi:hypothetical protein
MSFWSGAFSSVEDYKLQVTENKETHTNHKAPRFVISSVPTSYFQVPNILCETTGLTIGCTRCSRGGDIKDHTRYWRGNLLKNYQFEKWRGNGNIRMVLRDIICKDKGGWNCHSLWYWRWRTFGFCNKTVGPSAWDGAKEFHLFDYNMNYKYKQLILCR